MNRALLVPLALALSGCPFDLWVGDPPAVPPADTVLPGDGLVAWEECNSSGWCWERPASPGVELTDIDGTSSSDVWVAGESGFIAHFDGASWDKKRVPDFDIVDLHVIKIDDVIVTGLDELGRSARRIRDGVVERFLDIDGFEPIELFGSPTSLWSIGAAGVYRLTDDTAELILPIDTAVLAQGWASDDDVYVGVGSTELWHFDGASWSQIWPVAGAPAEASAPLVGDVAPDGTFFFKAPSSNGLGGYFARVTASGTWTFWNDPHPMNGMAAIDAEHAISVGGRGVSSLEDGVWREILDDPNVGNAIFIAYGIPFIADRGGTVYTRNNEGIWEASLGSMFRSVFDDVWGDDDGTLFAGDFRGGLWQRDAAGTWSRDDSGFGSFFSVDGTNTDNVWAVSGPQRGLFHYDGSSWQAVSFPGTSTAVVVVGDDGVWVGGCGLWHQDPLGVWSEIDVDATVVRTDDDGCTPRIADMFRGAGNDLFVMGQKPFENELYRFDGSTWTAVHTTTAPIVAGPLDSAAWDGERLWVADWDGQVVFDNGTQFVDAEAPPIPTASGGWISEGVRLRAFAPGHVFAYGKFGVLSELKDGAWTSEDVGVGFHQITGVWLHANNDLTVVGGDGLVLHKERP